jgi:putative ubiquitin-RnfH superfamily antitoxin RatB of RatAB toxin-antitoxin module
MTAPLIDVSVVYALPEEAFWQKMKVEKGTTALQAIEQSGVLRRYPHLDPAHLAIGIFMHPIEPGQVLADGDRVEIYRPLLGDPKEISRKAKERRAAKLAAEKAGKGGGAGE